MYAALFTCSIALLLAGYYYASVYRPIQSVRSEIRAEASQLVARDGDRASLALLRDLSGREDRGGRAAYHVLLASDDRVLITNLPNWPAFAGSTWLSVSADPPHAGEESNHDVLVLDRRLADGSRLMLGLDIEDLRQRERTVFGAAEWLISGGVLFGLVVGTLMSFTIGRRIDTINFTARGVMAGDLSERIPVHGSRDDFDRLAETLNLMLDRIQGHLGSIRRVSDSVAHELRTPLTRLHANLSELRLALPETSRSLVDASAAETEDLVQLFDAVLRIGRIESILDTVEMVPLSLSSMLEDLGEIFALSAEAKGVEFLTRIPDGISMIGNRNLLFQAIGNIVDNAIKFSPPGGCVCISAENGGDRELEVSVGDNGIGIPEAQRQNVFERFVRLPETSHAPGLGLGLSFVRAVADAHASRILLEDALPGLIVRWRFTTGL